MRFSKRAWTEITGNKHSVWLCSGTLHNCHCHSPVFRIARSFFRWTWNIKPRNIPLNRDCPASLRAFWGIESFVIPFPWYLFRTSYSFTSELIGWYLSFGDWSFRDLVNDAHLHGTMAVGRLPELSFLDVQRFAKTFYRFMNYLALALMKASTWVS